MAEEGELKSWECRLDEIRETRKLLRKTQKIPTLATTIDPLETPRLKLGIPVGTDKRSNRS